jgi:hypothetical protein
MTFHYARVPDFSPRDVCTSPLSLQNVVSVFPLLFLSPLNPPINWGLRLFFILYAHETVEAFLKSLESSSLLKNTKNTHLCVFLRISRKSRFDPPIQIKNNFNAVSDSFLITFYKLRVIKCRLFALFVYVFFEKPKTPVLHVLH